MEPNTLLDILAVAERLKSVPRHAYTSAGRRESVAEHSWRLALTAMLLTDEFPALDVDRVIRMCLIHDLGEAFTGDIPTFEKTDQHRDTEDRLLQGWVDGFPEPQRTEFRALLAEMETQATDEARLYKALDKLEAVIQHNEGDIATWLPLEYDLQRTYGAENVQFSPYLRRLKAEIDRQTEAKITAAGGPPDEHPKSSPDTGR